MQRTRSLPEITRRLDELYAGLSGHGISLAEMNTLWLQGASPLYGELTPAGVDRLLQAITPPLGPGDVFYDLGSGIGKICVHLCLGSAVGRVAGIELSSSRCHQAGQALEALRRTDPSILGAGGGRLEFIEADFLRCPLTDATVIYLCSLSYSAPLMKELARKMNTECPELRLVIAATAFPELGWEPPPRRVTLESTWSDTVPFYFYHRETSRPA